MHRPSEKRKQSADAPFTFHIIAVSGEVILHAEHLYVHASQPATGTDTGVMFRTCEGRCDYTGGRNHFASLDLLHTPARLARRIRETCHV